MEGSFPFVLWGRLVEGSFPFVLWWEKFAVNLQWSKGEGGPDWGVRECGQYINYFTNQPEFSLGFPERPRLQTASVTLSLPTQSYRIT